MVTLAQLHAEQKLSTPPDVVTNLAGRVVIVVGANTGLGFETAKHLARMNPGKLVLGCRDEKKGNDALKRIQEATGCTSLEMRLIDLCSFTSVKAFADKFASEVGRLDILIENAGVGLAEYTTTEDGWETMLQVNNLAPELLAILLLPLMLDTATAHPEVTPRITIVSSGIHHFSPLGLDIPEFNHILRDLSSEEHWNNMCANLRHHIAPFSYRYSNVKLLNIFFACALHQHLSNKKSPAPIIIDSVTPGLCVSDLMRNATPEQRVQYEQNLKNMAFSAEDGSKFLVHAAIGTEQDMRGKYISMGKLGEVSDFAKSEEGLKIQERIWAEMVGELTKVDARVSSIVESLLL